MSTLSTPETIFKTYRDKTTSIGWSMMCERDPDRKKPYGKALNAELAECKRVLDAGILEGTFTSGDVFDELEKYDYDILRQPEFFGGLYFRVTTEQPPPQHSELQEATVVCPSIEEKHPDCTCNWYDYSDFCAHCGVPGDGMRTR